MPCNTKEMVGVPVVTRSGVTIGKVASFDLDEATGRLIALRVKSRGLVSGLMAGELTVSWDAILELTAERVIVADGSVPEGATALALNQS